YRLHPALSDAAHRRFRAVDRAGRDRRPGPGRRAAPAHAVATEPGVTKCRLALAALCVFAASLATAAAATGADDPGVLVALFQWFADPAQWQGAGGIPTRLLEHVGYVAWSMLMGMAVALPLGIGLGHIGRGGLLAINVSNIGRAIPSF